MRIRTTNISRTRSLRTCLVATVVLCFTVFQLFYRFNDTTTYKSLLLYEHDSYYNQSLSNNETRGGEDEEGHKQNDTSSFILESFAISFDPDQVKNLQERNDHANLGTVLWVPGTDGMQQRTLNLWAQLTNRQHSPMTVEQASQLAKYAYNSPHAVGCYLSHWNLLRTLAHRPPELLLQQKHAYLILEEDAACAPGLKEEIEHTIQHLPSDWDLLFVGGKPFASFENIIGNNNNNDDSNTKNSNTTISPPVILPTVHGNQLIQEYNQNEAIKNWTASEITNQLIRQAICQGDFGKASGPLAPDGSRKLSQDSNQQAYWRINYMTNTHSYVVNPQRVAYLAQLLHPTMDVPVDIRIGDLMKSRQINAYMTTQMWCDQMSHQPLLQPQTWKGFFLFVIKGSWNYVWQTQMHLDDNCAF